MPAFSGYRLWLAIVAVGGLAALPQPDEPAARETAGREAAAISTMPAADPPTPEPRPGKRARALPGPIDDGDGH